ncbi:MAG: hypothetical protein ACSHXK_13165 [Oceanococcus sp.]
MATSLLVACSSGEINNDTVGIGSGPQPCTGSCQRTPTKLTVADINQIVARAAAEASALGKPAKIAVVDRVGNVLGVYAMNGSPQSLTITSTFGENQGVDGGLERLNFIPAELGAISKALTAAYFSSEGQAFSTRTANQIIQENFNPGEYNAPSGPLFGVQFSQLPCSDISRRFNGVGPDPGSHRSPLGFAADAGGLPLYKNGTPVGAIGVMADGIYGVDKDLFEPEKDNLDELIAVAGSFGFSAPRDRRADRVTAEGKTLRFSDVDFEELKSNPASAPASPQSGNYIAVTGYTNGGTPQAGTAFGQPESGVRPIQADPEFQALDAYVVVDENNANRFPIIAGTDGLLGQAEVRSLLLESLKVGNRSRAQVRRPVGDYARLTVVVSDTNGAVLGVIRAEDTLVDAIDVTIQKARSVAFFASNKPTQRFSNVPAAEYLQPNNTTPTSLRLSPLRPYINNARTFLSQPTAFADGAFAYSLRSIGLISRPFYPDGIAGTANGPFSKPAGEWSLFSTGAELDLIHNALIQHIAFVAGIPGVNDVAQNCTGIDGISNGFSVSAGQFSELPNGFTIFPGAVPIYRGNQLVGGLASSGDGADQDGMIPFLGLDAVSKLPGSTLGNAPKAIRSDQISVGGTSLRYVICPQSPFLNSDEEAACEGL